MRPITPEDAVYTPGGLLIGIATLARPGATALSKFLTDSEFLKAPASKKYHMARPGGLAEHSWNVYRALWRLNNDYKLGLHQESIIICGLLHDICKVDAYKIKAGEIVSNDDSLPLGHGEKSVIILQQYIKLWPDEVIAIRWHMGAWYAEGEMQKGFLNNAMRECPLLKALMLADQIATFFIE